MGNYYTNLDSQIQSLMNSFNFQFSKGDYISASMYLFSRNMAQPDEAHVKSMQPFKLPNKTFDTDLDSQQLAKKYCEKWLPIIEGKMSAFRKKNIDQYNEV